MEIKNKTTSCKYHIPVLLHESIEGLNIKSDGIYMDMTYGGGGHSKEILKCLSTGHLFAFDQDISVVDNLPESKNFSFIHCNYRYAYNYLSFYGINRVDGILADFGVSSFQFDGSKRGFSFRENNGLDMRMNKLSFLTAEHILNKYSEKELTNIFKNYGEIKNTKKIVQLILHARLKKQIKSTNELVEILHKIIPSRLENKYLAKIFQALRIAVNNELSAISHMLMLVPNWLKNGGRLVVISYHSLEDRLVKNMIRYGTTSINNIQMRSRSEKTKQFKIINKKVITPSKVELLENNRARSAKLRIAEKI